MGKEKDGGPILIQLAIRRTLAWSAAASGCMYTDMRGVLTVLATFSSCFVVLVVALRGRGQASR